MPANIPSTSNGGYLPKNCPSICHSTPHPPNLIHKKLLNTPNGYLVQPFRKEGNPNTLGQSKCASSKVSPVKSAEDILTLSPTTTLSVKNLKKSNGQISRAIFPKALVKSYRAHKNVRISEGPPAIIGYDGGCDFFLLESDSGGEGENTTWALAPALVPPYLTSPSLSNGGNPEAGEASSDEDGEYDDAHDVWEGGRNSSREDRRRWALQTALNTERNAITKNLSNPHSTEPRAGANFKPDQTLTKNGPLLTPAFKVRTWGDRECQSDGRSSVSPVSKAKSSPKQTDPDASHVASIKTSDVTSPPLVECKPIRNKIIKQTQGEEKQGVFVGGEEQQHVDNLRSDILGHISDFLLAENEGSDRGEKSLLEEIAESFKCATSANIDHSPSRRLPISIDEITRDIINDPIVTTQHESLNERSLLDTSLPLSIDTPSSISSVQVEVAKSSCQRVSLENKSFLFSHSGGLLGKLCTVATSIRESLTSHTVILTTTASNSNTPSLTTAKNCAQDLLSPQPHLYDLIEISGGRERLFEKSAVPQLDKQAFVCSNTTITLNDDKGGEEVTSPSLKVKYPLDSRHNKSSQASPTHDNRIVSPVYEELDYIPPSIKSCQPSFQVVNPLPNQKSEVLDSVQTLEKSAFSSDQKVKTSSVTSNSLDPQLWHNASANNLSNLCSGDSSSNSNLEHAGVIAELHLKGGKRSAVANFFGKSNNASHKQQNNLLAFGSTSSSRRSTREIRKEDIVVLLTSPLPTSSERSKFGEDIEIPTKPIVVDGEAIKVIKQSSGPLTGNVTSSNNTILRFDSKLAAVAKNINDTNGDRCLSLEKGGPSLGMRQFTITSPTSEIALGPLPQLKVEAPFLTKRIALLNAGNSLTLTEHSSLPTLTNNAAFDRSLFDATKSNSLDTNRAPVKYENNKVTPVPFKPKIDPAAKIPKETDCKDSTEGILLPKPPSHGIRSFLHLNGTKKRNGTLRSKSLDKSSAGLMPFLPTVDRGGDKAFVRASSSQVSTTTTKPNDNASIAELNLMPSSSSQVAAPSPPYTITNQHNIVPMSPKHGPISGHRRPPHSTQLEGMGKFSSLKKLFRKTSSSTISTSHRCSHQRSSLACLTEQTCAPTRPEGGQSSPAANLPNRRPQIGSSSYDDSGVSLTRTVPEDDYGTRKNPSYSSALDSFSSEESWSVSSASATEDKFLPPNFGGNHVNRSLPPNAKPNTSTSVKCEDGASRKGMTNACGTLQSTPLPPIPPNQDSGSFLNPSSGFATLQVANTSSSSELEFSGEGIVTARAQLLKNNASPIQRPLGKPRVPPPKPPVNQNLETIIHTPQPRPLNQNDATNESFKDVVRPNLVINVVETQKHPAKVKSRQVIKKPEVPARPPKLSPRGVQPLGKAGNVSIGKKSGKSIASFVNKEISIPNAVIAPPDQDVSDMPRRKPPPPPPIIMMRQENKFDANEYYDPLVNNPTSITNGKKSGQALFTSKDVKTTEPSNLTFASPKHTPSAQVIPSNTSSVNPNPFYEEYLTPVCTSVNARISQKDLLLCKNDTTSLTSTEEGIIQKGQISTQRFTENSNNNNPDGKKTSGGPCKIGKDQRNLIIAGLKPSQIKKNQREKIA